MSRRLSLPGRLLVGLSFTTALLGQSIEVQSLLQEAQQARSRKEYREAAACYQKILSIDPSLHPVRAELGMMHYLAGDLVNAEEVLQRVLQYDPKQLTIELLLGIVLTDLDRIDQALPHLSKVVQRQPEDDRARWQLARALYLSERMIDAVGHLQKLLDKNSGDPEVLLPAGACISKTFCR